MSVVLLSGGLDSATCLALDPEPVPVVVDYGQRNWHRESEASRRIARDPVWIVAHLPWLETPGDMAMVIPGRNIILLALAASVALARGIDTVTIGANRDDYENYVDCRPEFFKAAEAALGVKINTPLIAMTKPEVGAQARSLGVAVDETWSCYYPRDAGPCGECDACAGRAKALA